MAGRIMDLKDQLNNSLHDARKPWTSILGIIEEKTGVNRLYVFVGCIVFVALWLIFGFAAQLVCNAVSFVYPAYVSMHAIESPAKHDDTKWLTYWVVFAVFTLWEFFADIIVGFFPLYWLAKCMFLVWLMMPGELNGSIILYSKVIRPYFLAHHSKIDEAIENVHFAGSQLLKKD